MHDKDSMVKCQTTAWGGDKRSNDWEQTLKTDFWFVLRGDWREIWLVTLAAWEHGTWARGVWSGEKAPNMKIDAADWEKKDGWRPAGLSAHPEAAPAARTPHSSTVASPCSHDMQQLRGWVLNPTLEAAMTFLTAVYNCLTLWVIIKHSPNEMWSNDAPVFANNFFFTNLERLFWFNAKKNEEQRH